MSLAGEVAVLSPVAADFQAGIAATRTGDKAQARACFLRVLQADPRHEAAWLWMSNVMPTPEQALRCIDHVLALNPHHKQALEARGVLRKRLKSEEAAMPAQPAPAEPPPAPPAASPSTSPRRKLFGQALVEAGLITPEQLNKALKEQVQRALMRRPARLGEIVVELGLARPEQIEAVTGAHVERVAAPKRSEGPGQIDTFLLRKGLITRTQLREGLARQAELKAQGESPLLGEVLVELGFLRRDQLNGALFDWEYEQSMH